MGGHYNRHGEIRRTKKRERGEKEKVISTSSSKLDRAVDGGGGGSFGGT